jgi:hypothetical protein
VTFFGIRCNKYDPRNDLNITNAIKIMAFSRIRPNKSYSVTDVDVKKEY